MTTMTEIAKMAGVSQATVSRVLNGSTAVSPETKAVVMEWVRKLDFRPNQTARSLASNRSHLIGVVLPDMLNPYFTEIVYHIEKISAANGFNILFCNSDGSVTRELEIFKSLKSRQIEGLLIGFTGESSQSINEIINSNIKTVIITQNNKSFNSVSVSHYKGGEISAGHLIERGCEHFVFQGSKDDEKFLGFVHELKSNGFSEKNIELIEMGNTWLNTSRKAYVEAIKFIKNDKTKCKVGVFSVNDITSLGFIQASQELNIPIPEKYSIIGFDDTYVCHTVKPALTSISQPKEDIGRIAINMLLDIIAKKDIENEKVENIILTPSLVKRGTT